MIVNKIEIPIRELLENLNVSSISIMKGGTRGVH